MKNKIKIILIVLCCLLVSGCSNIKVIRHKQKKEQDVIKIVTDSLNANYEGLDIKLDRVDKAYTVDDELIRNGKSYYFKINDKYGNEAYAKYTDAFKNDKEVFEASVVETYGAIYSNKELEYYKYLAEKYITKNEFVSVHYLADGEDSNLYNKVKIVYKLNYKFEDMTNAQFANLLKLGIDLRNYKLIENGGINFDDPEIYLLFKGSKKYYYVSYYGLTEDKGLRYERKLDLVNEFTDVYNLKSYINFKLSDDEYNKLINNFNTIGKYLLDNVDSINTKIDKNNAYILINNYSKNNYLVSTLIKFKYDSDKDTYLYENLSLVDNKKIGNFNGSIIESW